MVRVVRLVHQIYLFLCLSPLSVFFFYWNCNSHKKPEFLWCSTVAYAEMTRTCLIEDSIEKENWFSDFRATLKAGNRKPESGIRNRNPESEPETRNRNPESGIRNPQIKENKFFMFAKIIQWKLLSVKNKRPSKKSLKLNLFWNKNFSTSVKIRTSVILSEVYDYGNLNKVRRNVIPSTLRASKIIIALTRNNRRTNFNRRKFLFQKRLSLRWRGGGGCLACYCQIFYGFCISFLASL